VKVDFIKAQTFVTQKELWIRPCTPFWGVDMVAGLFRFLDAQHSQEFLRRSDYLCNLDFLVLQLEESIPHNSLPHQHKSSFLINPPRLNERKAYHQLLSLYKALETILANAGTS